jgi:lysophospholipase L1-like esterase
MDVTAGNKNFPAPVKGRPTVYLLGDSITEQSLDPGLDGFSALLATSFATRADIVNRGFSGYNTRWVRQAVDAGLFASDAPLLARATLITVFLGANDAVRPEFGGGSRQHVPIPEYEENLRFLVAALRAAAPDTARILLITPPPIHTPSWLAHCRVKYADDPSVIIPPDGNRNNAAVGPYAAAVVSVGASLGVATLDIFSAMSAEPNYALFLSDGLHLSAAGNRFVFDQIMGHLKEVQAGVESVPRQLCHHSELAA